MRLLHCLSLCRTSLLEEPYKVSLSESEFGIRSLRLGYMIDVDLIHREIIATSVLTILVLALGDEVRCRMFSIASL